MHRRVADPLFHAPERDDYRLRDASPAFDLGIRGPSGWGLRCHPSRTIFRSPHSGGLPKSTLPDDNQSSIHP